MTQQPNTLVKSGDVEDYVLLVGGEHPRLVLELAPEVTKSCQQVVESRGFFTYRCTSKGGTTFTLAITGVGPSATEIAVVEYGNCGARLFIRAGTSGALLEEIARGSVVISKRALRFDGVSDLYVGRRLGAIADRNIVRALELSAKRLGIKYRSGLTLSTSGFYAMGTTASGSLVFSGQARGNTFEPRGLKLLQDLKERHRVLNVEMETATLFTLSRIYDLKSGSVCGISNHIPWKEGEQIHYTKMALSNAILVAVDALDYLHKKQS